MDDRGIQELRQLLAQEDIFPILHRLAAETPRSWAGWPLNRCLWFLRKRRGLTQAQLARKAGVARSLIARVEAGGDVRLSTLRAIFDALGFGLLMLPAAGDGHGRQPWNGEPDA
jgi:hypothetical protein